MKQRDGSVGRLDLLVSKDITARAYHFHFEVEFPPLENPHVIVLNSPWIGVSCI